MHEQLLRRPVEGWRQRQARKCRVAGQYARHSTMQQMEELALSELHHAQLRVLPVVVRHGMCHKPPWMVAG